MILTGGFDGFDVIDSRFWWFWQVVLMVLMLLTAGFDVFDDFDRWFWWFWCFDSRFWCFDRWFWWFWCFDSRFWWFWQVVLMVLMILTGGFDGFDVLTAGFDVFDDFDSWFWWFWCFDSRFWWFWQVVFVFEGCIINDRRFCLLKTLLSGNFPPTRRIPYQRIWDCAVKNCEVHLPQTPVLLKQKIKPTSRL